MTVNLATGRCSVVGQQKKKTIKMNKCVSQTQLEKRTFDDNIEKDMESKLIMLDNN